MGKKKKRREAEKVYGKGFNLDNVLAVYFECFRREVELADTDYFSDDHQKDTDDDN